MTESKRHTICKNRRARFNYLIEETIEAGIVELGLRVRSQMGVAAVARWLFTPPRAHSGQSGIGPAMTAHYARARGGV